MKLHLGCGDVSLPGFLNIDRRPGDKVDRVDDIGALANFELDSIEEIYCCHALDHFARNKYQGVLKRWYDLLQPGGVLRISLPDFGATVEQYLRTQNLADLQGQLHARQDYPDNVRHFSWDFNTARFDLEGIGFCDVKRYDAANWIADDCSRYTWEAWYYDERRFNYRSLNITARKPG